RVSAAAGPPRTGLVPAVRVDSRRGASAARAARSSALSPAGSQAPAERDGTAGNAPAGRGELVREPPGVRPRRRSPAARLESLRKARHADRSPDGDRAEPERPTDDRRGT